MEGHNDGTRLLRLLLLLLLLACLFRLLVRVASGRRLRLLLLVLLMVVVVVVVLNALLDNKHVSILGNYFVSLRSNLIMGRRFMVHFLPL